MKKKAIYSSIVFAILFCTTGKNLYSQSSYPNVVFILADDMGYGDLSCNNPDSKINTVNLDALAKSGMRFTAAHSSSSVCTPSRYSILTGRYNWRSVLKSGVFNAYDPPLIDSSRMTIADLFNNKGYHTAVIGKWHLGLGFPTTDKKAAKFNAKSGETNIDFKKAFTQSPNDLGFNYFYGIAASADMPPYMFIRNRYFSSSYDTIKGNEKKMNVDHSMFFRPGPASLEVEPKDILPAIGAEAVNYIKQQTSAKPFFLYLPITAPHTPVAPSDQFIGASKLHPYLDFCLEVDHTVGKIINTLKEKGLYENTVIIFTSDNGYAPYVDVKFLEDHGHYPSYIYRGYKADAWEGGHRVPLIVSWPNKIEAAKITNEQVSLTDWFATAANITHTKIPDNAGEDSYNLLPLLLGKKYPHPLREAIVSHSHKGEFCIQQDAWKLILCNEKAAGGVWLADKRFDASQGNTPYMLFNMELDPGETVNVYHKNPEIVSRLKTLLTRYINQGRSTKGKPQKNDFAEKWPQINWTENP